MTFKIDPEIEALIPPLSPDEFAGLKESILRDGCRDPLVVWTEQDTLLDGHHRYKICTTATPIRGFKTEPMSFPSRSDALAWVIRNQFSRRNINDFVRAELALKLKGILQEAAQRRRESGVAVDAELSGRVDDQIAQAAGLSRDTIRKVEAILQRGDEETIQKCREDTTSIHAGHKAVIFHAKRAKLIVRKEELERAPLPLPSGPFRVIVADPPWDFVGHVPYPTLTLAAICSMGERIRAVAEPEGCALWIWAVNSGIPQALEVMRAWGFEYRSILTWEKVDSGMGQPLLSVTEHAILAVRGEPRFLQGRGEQTTLLREKKVPVHSRKPDAFFRLVESLCLPPRLELFSRTPRDGWVVWGDEAEEEPAVAS